MKPHQSFTDTHDNSETPESQGLDKMGDFYYMIECKGPKRFYAKREYCEDTDAFVWQCEYECNGWAECDFRFTNHQRWRLVTENELRVLCRNTGKKVYTITDTDTRGRASIISCTPIIDANGIMESVMFNLCDTLNFPKPPEIPQVTEQVSEGVKFDDDKTRVDLLDPEWLEGVGRILAFGAKKYAANNWRKGIKQSRLLGAALRHIFAFARGEKNDPESGESHLLHASCCLMFMFITDKYSPEQNDIEIGTDAYWLKLKNEQRTSRVGDVDTGETD